MNNDNNYAPIPVGFRFHPTDEELVGYYLHGKVERAQRDQLIQELDLYKIEPWDLHEVCRIGDDASENQTDWYFFSRKDKKYPTGNRANRATTAGFWKATGRDKPIHTQHRHVIGMRKTLVFYKGRAPHGQKSDWIMHEFRLDEGPAAAAGVPSYGNTDLDGWVVCRVFRKIKVFKTKSQDTSCSLDEDQNPLVPGGGGGGELLSPPPYPSPSSAVHLLFHDHLQQPQPQQPSVSLACSMTCKQEISVDDYGTPPQDSPSAHYFQDPPLLHPNHHAPVVEVDQQHLEIHPMRGFLHHHYPVPCSSRDHLDLAPCSSTSSSFRTTLNPNMSAAAAAAAGGNRLRADVESCGEYVNNLVVPFDRSTVTGVMQCEELESPATLFWMDGVLCRTGSSSARGDQTLADVTGHVGRTKRHVTGDHLAATSSINLETQLVHLWNNV